MYGGNLNINRYNTFNKLLPPPVIKRSKYKINPKKSIIILGGYFKNFLTLSTVHGLYYLAEKKRHPVEILIWLTFVIAALYGAVTISYSTWIRYQENPTVISMERDRFNWNTSFPSATICPSFKYSEVKLEKYVSESKAENKTELREFLISLANAGYKNFEKIPTYDGISPDDYLKILAETEFEFFPSVSNSGTNGYLYTLEKIISEMGTCYSFNSMIAIYSSPKYWLENRWDLVKGNETFYVHPLDGEVFANLVNLSTGFEIFIHGPYETADSSSKSIISENGYFLQVYLTALTIYTSKRAKELSVGQRKCRFHDESNLKHNPAYSYKLCKMECRIEMAKKLCGCIPFFYRKLANEEICGVEGMHCLGKNKDELIRLKKACTCLQNCDEVNYVVEDIDTREWFLGSNLQWGLKEYPRMRLKRDVLFGFTDLLVYVGGMTGLFLGCSVLSFIEVIYYFTLKLFWFTIKYGKDTNNNIK